MDKELLEILACPKCRGPLTAENNYSGLICAACAVVYPVIEHIPVLLIDEAISKSDWDRGKRPITAISE